MARLTDSEWKVMEALWQGGIFLLCSYLHLQFSDL